MPGAWQGALCFIASDRRACVRICGQIWPLRPSEAWLLPRPVRRVGKSGFFLLTSLFWLFVQESRGL